VHIREQLLSGKKKLAVWGCGYIGYSTMANFAVNGVNCVGVDIDEDRVDQINRGAIPIDGLEYWLGFDVRPLVKAGLVKAVTNWKEVISKDTVVHMIAVRTEEGDKPCDYILKDVIEKLSTFGTCRMEEVPLIIVESTLTPGKVDHLAVPILESAGLKVGEDVLLGVAPRRDWFISPEKNLKTLPRIIGGTTKATTELMRDILSIVCDTLVIAPDHRHAELVKGIENAYRHAEITLANQLSLAYPHIDMREVLRLVGTKWNMETYYPSCGIGGYCIALGSKYTLEGATNPAELTILHEAVRTDSGQPILVAKHLINKGIRKVGILGLSYKGDLKVHNLSPAIKLAGYLKENNIVVKVNDPYYSPKEVEQIAGTDYFEFPEGLREFEAIIIIPDHSLYRYTNPSPILENLTNCKLILDTTGIWKAIAFNFKSRGIEYHLTGDKHWLSL